MLYLVLDCEAICRARVCANVKIILESLYYVKIYLHKERASAFITHYHFDNLLHFLYFLYCCYVCTWKYVRILLLGVVFHIEKSEIIEKV